MFLNSVQFRRPLGKIFPLAVFLLYGWIALLPDLRLSVPDWIGISAGIIILLTSIVFFSRSNPNDWSAGFIILVAAILRIMFLWRSPELSDDIFRYLFDGMMLLSGQNPFAAAPADLMPENPVMLNLIMKINHTELPTIYPPAAQVVFAVGAFFGGVFGMKLVLVFLDLLTCILMIKILASLGLSRIHCILYAWHPLPVIEIAASGHMDAAVIFFTFATVFWVFKEKALGSARGGIPSKPATVTSLFAGQGVYGFVSGIGFAAAVLTKWVPLIFIPGILLLTSSGKRRYFGCGFLVSFTALCWMFLPDILNCFYTLSVYAANWEFSGFVFRRLRSATGSGAVARYVLAAAFIISTIIVYFRYSGAVRSLVGATLRIFLNPQLSNGNSDPSFRQKRAGGAYHPIGIPDYGDKEVFKGFYATAMAFLLLTPTLHPWYGLYLAAFLPFVSGPAGLVLSWSVFLSYRIAILYGLTGEWVENDIIPIFIAAAPAAAVAAAIIVKIIHHRFNKPSTGLSRLGCN